MSKNKGKNFEQKIKESFEKVDGVSIDRVHDQVTKYKGSSNVCDFIVYKKPYEYYIECKSVHGNTLSFDKIREAQWEGLTEKSKIHGVTAGVICWWVDKDITRFIPIELLNDLRINGYKSIRYDLTSFKSQSTVLITGVKQRTYFKYDMLEFLAEMEFNYEHL